MNSDSNTQPIYNPDPRAPINNRHHWEPYRNLDDFYDEFRYDPDYPSTSEPVNLDKLTWYKLYGI